MNLDQAVGNTDFDVLDVYAANVAMYGEAAVFFLESAGGPEPDNRESIIGLFGPLTVSITRSVVTVDAPDQLRSLVWKSLTDREFIDASGRLVDDRQAWRVPTVLATDLDLVAAHEGLNGFFVTLGYDAAFYTEDLVRRIPADDPTPDLEYRLVVSTMRVPKGRTDMASVSTLTGPHWPTISVVPAEQAVGAEGDEVPSWDGFNDEMLPAQFYSKVEVCKEHIRAGDIYQIQIGHKIQLRSERSPLDTYRRLRRRNPSPYMALVPVSTGLMIVASPELYVRKEGQRATMRPIAGTMPKPSSEGPVSLDALVNNEKECAEHIMLVDLCRNDLGRVARYGSLTVPDFMTVEEYSHLFHLVSEVQVDVREPFDVFDLIKAGFPAGTMTGAPKVRAMEIIEELELSRRGYYAGAFGLVPLDGDCLLGLTIRMATYREGLYTLRASAGIVADSTTEGEWRETLIKMSATFWAITDEELLEYVH